MDHVPDDACNFETVPKSLKYDTTRDKGYLTLNAILSLQADCQLHAAVRDMREKIQERAREVGVQLLDNPAQGQGLYVYPDNTLHCSLVDFASEGCDTFEEVAARDFSNHLLMEYDTLAVKPCPVVARWFYGGKAGKKEPVHSFSLGLFFDTQFIDALKGICREEKAKAHGSGRDEFPKGVVNLARFMTDKEELAVDQSEAFVSLFEELNQQMSEKGIGPFSINLLTLVKSTPWLSEPFEILKKFDLSECLK